jgi:hypothetical protein
MPTSNRFPASPPKEALDYFRSKKLKPSFDYRDVWREEHGYAFTVAKGMQLDLLADIQNALGDALANGKTFQQFKKELTPVLQKQGWWGTQEMEDPVTGELRTVQLGSPRRLKVIYDTNMRTARAAGQWDRIKAREKTHPYLIYELGPSERHRVQHEQWAGKILPVDDPFWSSHFPPNGWGCKCHVRAMTAREAERNGGPSESPPLNKREWVNKRTGEIMQVPSGIDPGFDINPGIARSAHLQQVVTTKINQARPAIAQAAVRELVQGPPFAQFMAKPAGEWPVAALSADMKGLLGSKNNAVMLSADTLAKQRANHPELTPDEYRLIPDVVDRGQVIDRGDNKLVFFHMADRLYKLSLKVTGNRDGLFVTTFYRTNPREFERDLRKGVIVRGQDK